MPADRNPRALTPQEARRVYNRIGRMQDWQSFYEGPAVAELMEHADFPSSSAVYEFGCGTGAFGRRLLEAELSPTATYRAVDVSDTMLRLARERLAPWSERSRVDSVTGELPLPGDDRSCDRFVAIYVLDLLDTDYAMQVLEEAHRLLAADGKLCAISLTEGTTAPSRAVCRSWDWIWNRAPRLVGGCRPIDLVPLLAERWRVDYRKVVTAWAIPSEVVVATPVGS